MIPKPLFDLGVATFGVSLVLAVLGARAISRILDESNIPIVGGSSAPLA